MKRNQSSLTAAGIAIMRALESEKPVGERVCFDSGSRPAKVADGYAIASAVVGPR